MASATTGNTFGSCCETLRDILGSDQFEPLISVDDDGVLYASIGIIEVENDEPGMVEFPVIFCPFCGTRVQDDDVVSNISTD